MFQSTLPWWERPLADADIAASLYVSIHAPVVGATDVAKGLIGGKDVSIHAPVVGATRFSFNKAGIFKVSIHAPVVGATCL